MLCLPWSMAIARVRLSAPPLAAQYEAARAPPFNAHPEPVLMMLPPPFLIMLGITSCEKKIDALQGHVDGADPFFLCQFNHIFPDNNPCVVAEDVDFAEPYYRAVYSIT